MEPHNDQDNRVPMIDYPILKRYQSALRFIRLLSRDLIFVFVLMLQSEFVK